MATIREFFQNLLYQVPAIGITDIVDILVVSIIFYSLLRLIRSTSAARVARAILLLLAITLLTDVLNLYTLNWLLNKILEVGVVRSHSDRPFPKTFLLHGLARGENLEYNSNHL